MKFSVNLLFYHLTPRTSLKVWEKNGTLSRELKFIFSLVNKLEISHCIIVSHGNITEDTSLLTSFSEFSKSNTIFAILSQKEAKIINNQMKDSIYSQNTKVSHYAHQAYSILSIPVFGAILNNKIEVYLRFGWSPFLLFSSTEKINIIKNLSLFIFEGISILVSNKIIVTTNAIKNSFIRRFFWSKEKIFVIPNYVSKEFFRSNQRISKKENTFLYVGRLSKEKNLFNLIKACNSMRINLDIVGQGPLKDELLKISKNNIRFLGNIENSCLPEILAKYKFLVLPSFSEGAPKVVYEAMAVGLIPLLTPFPEAIYLNKKKLSFISKGFSKNDLIKLFQKIKKLKKDKYIDYASRCRNHSQLEYSIENSLNLHLNLFNNAKR